MTFCNWLTGLLAEEAGAHHEAHPQEHALLQSSEALVELLMLALETAQAPRSAFPPLPAQLMGQASLRHRMQPTPSNSSN